MRLEVPRLEVAPRVQRLLVAVMGLALATLALGLWLDPLRTWVNYLIALVYVTGIGVGAALFIASQYVTGAGWSVAIRRIPEAMTSILGPAVVGVLLLGLGFQRLYGAPHAGLEGGAPAAFDATALMLRLLPCFGAWWLLSRLLVRSSLAQDFDADPEHTRRNVRNSVFVALVGVWTFCLASVELLMSLQPGWTSTIFGFLSLAGAFLSSLATLALFVLALRRRVPSRLFTAAHVHDLGRLLFAFSIFWIYMWASQHLLIWYSNLPEETSYYVVRHTGAWGVLSFVSVCLNWLAPFLLLLSGHARASERCVLAASLSILVGRWLDLYIVAAPAALATPSFGPLEIVPLAGACALFLWLTLRTLSRHVLVPVGDPYLVESLPELSAHEGHSHSHP